MNLRGRCFVLDVDGTCIVAESAEWRNPQVLPGTRAVLEAIRRSGGRFVFLTNGSALPPEEYTGVLRRSALPVEDQEVITPGAIAAEIIAREYPDRPVLVLGQRGLWAPLEQRGIPCVGVEEGERAGVVLVGWDPVWTYEKLAAACRAIWNGAAFLVTSLSPWYATKHGRTPGLSAALAAAITYITQKPARLVGKPSRDALRVAAARLGVPVEELVVVGDDVELDFRMGKEAGARTVLVLTGVTLVEELEKLPPQERPDLVLNGIQDLLAYL
ncbi:MAG: HAD hydrolase-like protein [Armatimonadota bacterium]|nr:HAD hydrolase-like protein [Armatimonadota bacterium]